MAIESLLLAIGPNDRDHVDTLLGVALDIAEPAGAAIDLLHVFSERGFEDLIAEDPDLDHGTSAQMVARSLTSIEAAVNRLGDRNLEYAIHGAVGDDPAEEITDTADAVGSDMVIIGGGSRSPAGKALFGDQAQRVLLNAPCPVSYVKREE
jgi:nucleotide-binding universal stress UspA family protein